MKKWTIILLLVSLVLSSCKWEYRDDTFAGHSMRLSDLLQSFDLWYVDIDQTTGTGDVGFVSRAFTMSFMPNHEVYANNNMVGFGYTGNGYGISIGTYRVYNRDGILSITDDIAGTYDFIVNQIDQYTISLTNLSENVTYFLVGYQQSEFDYDAVFYDNVAYFLQEYEAWTKYYADLVSPSEPFVSENHLQFYVSGNRNSFASSESSVNVPVSQIYWDYTGDYEVLNTSNQNRKELRLYYDINNDREEFILTIIDDQHIRLKNILTGNIYKLEGRGYIQYRPAAKRLIRSKYKNLLRQRYLK